MERKVKSSIFFLISMFLFIPKTLPQKSYEHLENEGSWAFISQKYEEAIRIFEEALKVELEAEQMTSHSQIYYFLSASYYKAGSYNLAIKNAEIALDKEPAEIAHAIMGLSYYHLGNNEEAKKELLLYLEKISPSYYIVDGIMLSPLGDSLELVDFEIVELVENEKISLNPESPRQMAGLGKLYLGCDTSLLPDRKLRLIPEEKRQRYATAHQKAIEYYVTALKLAKSEHIDTTRYVSYIKSARELADMAKRSARKLADMAKRASPQQPKLVSQKSEAFRKWVPYLIYISSLLITVLLLYIYFLPQYYLFRGDNCFHKGDLNNANYFYDKLFNIQKGKFIPYKRLREIYLKLDRKDERAVKVYEKLYQENSNDKEVVLALAEIYAEKMRANQVNK